MAQWRLTLDVPFSFPIEQGFLRDVKSCDFRVDKAAPLPAGNAQLWQEPNLGIVMLHPNVMDRSFTGNFMGLANWNYQQAFPYRVPPTIAEMVSPVRDQGSWRSARSKRHL